MISIVLPNQMIIALAVAGALIATYGSILFARQGSSKLSRILIWFGYGLAGASFCIFLLVKQVWQRDWIEQDTSKSAGIFLLTILY